MKKAFNICGLLAAVLLAASLTILFSSNNGHKTDKYFALCFVLSLVFLAVALRIHRHLTGSIPAARRDLFDRVFRAKALLIGFISLASISCHAQTTVKKDASGNYIAVKDTTSHKTNAKQTGQTYTDLKGQVYPVYVSKNGKFFIVRTSKNGNQYNQYLKL